MSIMFSTEPRPSLSPSSTVATRIRKPTMMVTVPMLRPVVFARPA